MRLDAPLGIRKFGRMATFHTSEDKLSTYPARCSCSCSAANLERGMEASHLLEGLPLAQILPTLLRSFFGRRKRHHGLVQIGFWLPCGYIATKPLGDTAR